jgi:hypothetical protein
MDQSEARPTGVQGVVAPARGAPAGWAERPVAEGAEGERRVPFVFRLDGEEQQEQREDDHARGPGDGEPVRLLRPADNGEGADRHQQAGEGEPGDERAGQDLLGGWQRRAFHQPGGGFAVAEPDRLDGDHGEAHPQRLQREQWYALGDVEDGGADEGDDVAEQAADLEPDVPGEVVIQPAAEFDGLDDGGEVVVGQDHHRVLPRPGSAPSTRSARCPRSPGSAPSAGPAGGSAGS